MCRKGHINKITQIATYGVLDGEKSSRWRGAIFHGWPVRTTKNGHLNENLDEEVSLMDIWGNFQAGVLFCSRTLIVKFQKSLGALVNGMV